ncbi:MAG: hypothetical protein ABEJ48_00730 [Halobacteriales archaeon]
MRTYRFVRFLGDRVGEASRDVATALNDARTRDERLTSGDRDPHERVRRELPRSIAVHVDGTEKRLAEFRAKIHAPEGQPANSRDEGGDLGVVVHASLPDFEQITAILAKTVDGRALTDPEYSLAEVTESTALEQLLALTADAFVFVVGDERVHVVPAQGVATLTDPARRKTPHRALYSRQLGRFFEEFAEGFVGDGGLAPDLSTVGSPDETNRRVLSWAESHDIERVLTIQVSTRTEETEATLRDFVGGG